MILLIDIGNTHIHVGLASPARVVGHTELPTNRVGEPGFRQRLRRWVGKRPVEAVSLASVVPWATPHVRRAIQALWGVPCFELNHATAAIGIDYPRPQSIGADRLANVIAASKDFGAPLVAVDFGTAVTLDVLDQRGFYVGGIIAPGLSAMTEYLHDRTALLPRITIRDTDAVVGKTTREAMLIGAVHGYAGLIRELVKRLRQSMKVRRLPVVATGGYAGLMARRLPEITAVVPMLTLNGLRLAWRAAQSRRGST